MPSAPDTAVRRSWLASFNASSLGVTIGFGFAAALLFSPVFAIGFFELLGRTLFVAIVLLLVFVALQHAPDRWFPRWLPRWAATPIVVALAAPAAAFLVYLVKVGGDLSMLLHSEPRMTGLLILGGAALVLGVVITQTALVREREARTRNLELQLELERQRLERQGVDAQLARLQAQIEPHFLFNTLGNVQALVESGSPRAAPVLQSLIAYLRAAMPRLHASEPTLADELALVRAYLELMQMRMPDRLQFAIDVDARHGALRFPPMALLTLVENAVHHGIDPAEDGGRIEVGAGLDTAAGRLHLWVADSGVGMADDAAPGTGLANLRARLAGYYQPAGELQLSERAPRGLRAEIVIPA
jgi:signal transduction histidine kinase